MQFIQKFSKITVPLISILKTLRSIKLAKTKKSNIKIGDNNKVELDGGSEFNGRGELDCKDKFDNNEIGDNGIIDNKVDDDKVSKRKNHEKMSKSKKTISFLSFPTFRARLAFIRLRQAFYKASIFHYFDPECHIQIDTDTLGYRIGGVLN